MTAVKKLAKRAEGLMSGLEIAVSQHLKSLEQNLSKLRAVGTVLHTDSQRSISFMLRLQARTTSALH